ncbi:uncharacterized protein LOC113561833 [Ooceraea biroi]|uniref:Uncharacterized protein n=1 Tax=Ooceraea biroi TaxID=2015173 RepID=A0A026X2K2_OOCBI|nr:uncharacterized protein LOC113561833 [Ooceraea biroi]EZA62231.1 hypothetical protein X777_00599 [Ooceraea biroi]
MNVLPGLLRFSLREKSQEPHVLNESLKCPQSSASHIMIPMILPKNFKSIGQNDSIMGDRLLLQRNISEKLITRLKRWKSTQSSCEDDCSKKLQGSIEDHQQSSESCEKSRIRCDDDHQLSAENCQKSSSDLLSHQEYYQSVESSLPIYSDKPVPYNDRQACDSTKRDPQECSPISIDECGDKRTRWTTSSYWTTGKPATERELCHEQKSIPSAYSKVRTELYTPRKCSKEESKMTKENDSNRVTYPTQRRSESETRWGPENTETPNTRESCLAESKTPEANLDSYEHQIKPDPPPPRYQHWTENPPPYCDHCSKEATITVKPSPMMFVPKKGPWKSSLTGTAWPCHENSIGSPSKSKRSQTVVKTKTKCAAHSREISSGKSAPRRMVSFEDKCADFLTLPAPASKTKPEIQRFPTLTKCGRCRIERSEKEQLLVPDISDCKPNVASLKYQLSKCPRIKEMWSVAAVRDSPVDVGMQFQRSRTSSSRYQTTKRPRSRRSKERATRTKRRFKSSGWTRQRYKVRLKIFRKGDGRLDPCLPRIAELRQPRGEAMPPSPFKDRKLFETTLDRKELSPRSRNSCSDYCPTKCPVVENKSYPTKMDECRMVREQNSKKCPRKKHC